MLCWSCVCGWYVCHWDIFLLPLNTVDVCVVFRGWQKYLGSVAEVSLKSFVSVVLSALLLVTIKKREVWVDSSCGIKYRNRNSLNLFFIFVFLKNLGKRTWPSFSTRLIMSASKSVQLSESIWNLNVILVMYMHKIWQSMMRRLQIEKTSDWEHLHRINIKTKLIEVLGSWPGFQ